MNTVPFWGPDFSALAAEDPDIADILLAELDRARSGLPVDRKRELHLACGARRAQLHLEQQIRRGLPGKRYYGGCAEVDKAELIGIERAKVVRRRARQPAAPQRREREHRGLRRLCGAGEKVLAMSLPHGVI